MIAETPSRRPALPAEALEIARRLGEQMQADSVWLYGSHARGEAGSDSDLDFLVVVPDSTRSRYGRSVDARRLVGDVVVPKDILVMTRQEWTRDLTVACSLASTVSREGILLHG